MPGENLTRTEAQERAKLLQVHSYDITLDLDPAAETFRSITTVQFDARTIGASTFIDLIAPTVHRVTLNGLDLEVGEVFADSRIQLANLASSNTLRVEADCAYMHSGEGLHRATDPVDGEAYLYTQFEVADSRRVFAVFEQPDLKAKFQFTVSAPKDWQVLSNSPTPTPTPSADDSKATWRFAPTPLLSSYVTAIVAGPYERVEDELTSSDGRTIPLAVLCRKSLAPYLDAEEIFEVTKQGFAFYEDAFDYPYPYAKYDQIFVPEFNAGAMENAGCVTHTEKYVFRSKVPDSMRERRVITVLHELAHMWFGDLVTMRWWNDLWLNESFAEYASHLAAAEATRWTSAWTTFASMEKNWAYAQDQLPSTHPIVATINDLEDVQVNFDGITYAKGASVLRQLVAWVGQDKFLAGVRAYFKKHAWGNTELNDLLSELEVTSGRDLKEWSKQWLEAAGVTLLRSDVESGVDELITAFRVIQEAPPEHPLLRPHRIGIGSYSQKAGGQLRLDWHVETDVAGAMTEVAEVVGKPRGDIVLLNDGDLAYAKTRLDPTSTARAVRTLRTLDDSLARTLIWSSAWDATRDGKMAARDFTALVLANIGAESDSTVITVLLRQLATALALYVTPEKRLTARTDAAHQLWSLAQAAEPGSDAQLQFIKAFARQARLDTQYDCIAGVLAGAIELEGLSLDTDLKWELLESLVVAGRAGDKEISHALADDDTTSGRQAAASARAAIPSAEAKEAAWKLAAEDPDVVNAIQDATIAGFSRVNDRWLLMPFVEKYFACLDEVWASRTHDQAATIVEGLYPILLLDTPGAEVLERTDAYLSQLGNRTPALARLVIESRADLVRALQAQACDRARA